MQTKNHARTAMCIATLVIASLVLGGCLSSEENVEDFSGGNSVNTPTNSAPVISGNPTTVVNVGGFYSFVPTASDADGDALTFSIENDPSWASFNSGSGEVSGQPTLGDVGVYQDIRISVTDGADSASLQPSLSINVCPPGSEANCCDSTPTAYDDENGPPGNGPVIGDLGASHDTFHSIGFVWDIDGDADHDGSVSVRYRKAGACNFAPATPLIRNDYAWVDGDEAAEEPANNFAGSLMFLTPGTTYEVVLELSDPDGGRAIRVRDLTTRAIPRKPTAGRTLYVVPGNGGGDGSDGNPFQGIAAANAAALPGDIFKLRNGIYAKATLTASGTEDNYIVYEEDPGDPGAVIDAIEVDADHLWIDNLAFVWDDPTGGATNIRDQPWTDTSGIYIQGPSDVPDDIVITNNSFNGFMNGVQAPYPLTRWVVMDNDLVGFRPVGIGGMAPVAGLGSTGKGINIGGENQWGRANGDPPIASPSCVVAYNSITRFTDGIGVYEDSDVYGNRVWDGAGNAVSMDGAYGNVRVWGNVFQYSQGAPITFQPQRIGPWYWLYNQMGQAQRNVFKFRGQDRAVLINNTFLSQVGAAQNFMRFFTRNNLFIVPTGSGANWNSSNTSPPAGNTPQFTADWNTNLDYDGFDPGTSGNFFFWESVSYSTIARWTTAVGGGAEANAIEVNADLIFEDYTLDPFHSLELAAGPNTAVDAGQVVGNLSDFHGSTPDLGAHQRDATPLPYGPRSSGTPLDQQVNYWAKH